MLGDGSLSFSEFIVREPTPLAQVQDAVLMFLDGRTDAALFGAQAVNAYVQESRMTEDVDIMSPRAKELAEEIRAHLAKEFHMAARVRKVKEGLGYRVYQVRKPKNRHLVDVRQVEELPPVKLVQNIQVIEPVELISGKVHACVSRQNKPKAGTDWRDLAMLVLQFPKLKTVEGPVTDRLVESGVDDNVLKFWADFVRQDIGQDEDDGY